MVDLVEALAGRQAEAVHVDTSGELRLDGVGLLCRHAAGRAPA
jgi:hypothetical protein